MPNADQTLADLFADLAGPFGLSRPAGQCFAAIWRAAQAPCADDLVARLGLSRSNISTALKELRGWGLIGVARAPGDRKEYFTAPSDAWDVLRLMTAARHRLVLAPVVDRLMQAEAAMPDVRFAALHEVMADLAASAQALTALDAPGFARRLKALGEAAEKPRKKKKKH